MEAVELAPAVHGVIRARRSVRKGYTGKPLSAALLRSLIYNAACAPSGSNTQGIRFLVETRPEMMKRFADLRRAGDFVGRGSALILVFTDRSAPDWTKHKLGAIWRLLAYQDAGAAIQNLLLSAQAWGLGSCWISGFAEMDKTALLGGKTWAEVLEPYRLPVHLEIMGAVVIGEVEEGALGGDVTHRGRAVARKSANDYILSFDGRKP